MPKTVFSRKSEPIIRQSPFFLNVMIVSQMFTLVTRVFSTISRMIDRKSLRYLGAVVAPHFNVYAMSFPEPNGSATKTSLPISTSFSST